MGLSFDDVTLAVGGATRNGVTVQHITVGCGACAACSQEEVDEVFKAAKAAYKGWAKTPLWKRAEYLHKVAALMKENAKVGGRYGWGWSHFESAMLCASPAGPC